MEAILQIENLCVSFWGENGELQATRGLSFELMRGETLALVGASGSGKTACARAIAGLLPLNGKITGGSVIFDGRDLAKLNDRQMCKVRGAQIGMVFQDPFSALNPLIKVGAQIAAAARRAEKLPQKTARQHALQLLREVGIKHAEECFERYPFQLSGGMRQRAVLAIALAMNPSVLICDEPTTALDVTIQARVLELLENVRRERELTMLYITHDLAVVAAIADRVAVIEDGAIAEIGDCEDIFHNPQHEATKRLLSAAKYLGG